MRTQYPSVLPVQITERVKNVSDIYKIANVKLTPVNKSYPLISTESPRTEIFFPSDSVLNLDNAILEADVLFNHLGNSGANAPNNYARLRYPPRYGLASLIEEMNVYINGVQASTTKRYNFIHNWVRDWLHSYDVEINDGLNTCEDPSIIYTYQNDSATANTGRIIPKRGFPVGETGAGASPARVLVPDINLRHKAKYHMNLSDSIGFFGEGSSKILNTALLGEIKLEIVWTSQIACCIAGSASDVLRDTSVGGIPAQTALKIQQVLKAYGNNASFATVGDTADVLAQVGDYVRRRAVIQNTTHLFMTGDTGNAETGNFTQHATNNTFGNLANGAIVADTSQSFILKHSNSRPVIIMM
jgi:hypothetical protein